MYDYTPEGRSNKFDRMKYAGYYVIGDSVKLAVLIRPAWFNRKMIKLILGWTWEDNK